MTTFTLLIDAYDYGAAPMAAAIGDATTLVIEDTAGSVTQNAVNGCRYVAVFNRPAAYAAGVYAVRIEVNSIPGLLYCTLAGVDGEVVHARMERTAELDSDSLVAVNAQVVDALSVDTYAELSAVPAATSSLKDKITWLFMYARNKITQSATEKKLYADNGTTVVATSPTTDNGTTFTKGEDT